MPPPETPVHHSRPAISAQSLTWAAAAVSMVLCLALYWLHCHQEDAMRHSRRLLTDLREARMDLARGFIHLNLAEDPGSPFHREEGIALLDQSMAALREAQTQIAPSASLGPEEAELVRTFQAKVTVFREHLATYNRAGAKAREGLKLPLRLAFHELEELAQRMDYKGQIAMNKLADRLDFFFTATLVGSVALLGVLCLVMYHVGRRQQQAEAALRQSEAQLRTLGDNIPGGAIYQLLMPSGGGNRYTYVSAGFEKIFGMPAERILADPKVFWELVNEEDRQQLLAEEQRCAREMAVFDMEFRQRSVGGDVKWIHARSTPRLLADGSILWDGVAADVTERKQAEQAVRESEARLRAIFDHTTDTIFSLRVEGSGRFVFEDINNVAISHGRALDDYRSGARTPFDLFSPETARSLCAQYQQCVDARRLTVLDQTVDTPSGWREFNTRLVPVFSPDGAAVVRVVGFAQDVTERKAAEDALRHSEEKFRRVVESNILGVIFWRADGQLTEANQAFCDLIGCTQEDVLAGRIQWTAITPSELLQRDLQGIEEVNATGICRPYEKAFVRSDGRRVPVLIGAGMLGGRNDQGVAFVIDITERKQLEERLRESERRHALLFEKSTTPTVLLKLPDTVIVDVNEACAHLTGFTREELCGRTAVELGLTIQESRQEAISPCGCEAALDGLEMRLITKSGAERIVVSKTNPLQISGQTYAITTLQDITARKAAEEALRENEERLQFVLEGSQLGLWDWNIVTGAVQRNERWAEMLGFTLEEINLTVKQWSDLIHPDERAAAMKSIEDHLQGRTDGHVCEYRMRTKSGDYRWILDQARIMARDAQGRPLRMSGTHTDIHTRKQSEEALRQSEERLDFSLRAGHIGAWSVSLRDRTATRTLIQARIFGHETAEAPWSLDKFLEHVLPEDRGWVRGRIQEGIAKQQEWEIECRIRRTDGAVRWILVAGGLEHAAAGHQARIYGIVQDITDRKEIEKTLRESENKYRTLFESSRDAIMIVDPGTHQFINCNPTALEMFGIGSEAELNARGPAAFSPERQPDGRLSADVVKEMDASVMQKGGHILEWQHQRLSGEVFDADVLLARIEWNGRPVIMATVRDITERKRTEERLRASQEQLRLKLDSILSPDVELREEELVNMLDIPALQSLMDNFSKLSHAVVAILDTKGKVLLKSGWQDICTQFHRVNPETARYCTESGLALSERLRPGEHIACLCRNGLWDVVTPLIVGGKHVGNISTGQFFYEGDVIDEEAFAAQAARCGFDRDAYLAALRCVPRVSREWVETLMVFLTQFSELVSRSSFSNLKLAKALVQQKRIEDDLRTSEEQLRLFVKHAPVGIAMVDRGMRYLAVSERWLSDYRIADRSIIGRTHYDVFPDVPERWKEIHRRCLAGEVEQRDADPFLRNDGTMDWVHWEIRPWRTAEGRVGGLIIYSELITERVRSEQALRDSEFRRTLALDAARAGIWEWELATGKNIWSDELWKLYGLPPKSCEPSFDVWLQTIHPEDRPSIEQKLQEIVQQQAEISLEWRTSQAQGEARWLMARGRPLRDEAGRVIRYMGVVMDISERKQLEQERIAMEAHMRQQQKLESIGTLASGVAHEINNPINGILNYAQLIQDRLPDDSPLAEFTGEIMHETQRVALIVRNLLTFARNEKQSHSPARVADIIEAVLSLVRTVIRHDQITLVVNVPDGLPQLKCRSQQIQQVIMNLVTNSRDALNERYPGHHPGKVLSISARLFETTGRCWIRLTVEDHGAGIPPQVRERMFDPFFTTKDRSLGTGLGLSISHGIVMEHNGQWTVESEPGQFTRMHVDLPVDNGWNL